MIIGSLEPELNKWQLRFTAEKYRPERLGFSPYIQIALIKLKSIPPRGAMITRENYQGFIANLKMPTYDITWYSVKLVNRWRLHEKPMLKDSWEAKLYMNPLINWFIYKRWTIPIKIKFYKTTFY